MLIDERILEAFKNHYLKEFCNIKTLKNQGLKELCLLVCLENLRLKLTDGEMNGDVIDIWELGNIEQHPLNFTPYKAGFAGGFFHEANNFHFVFLMIQWFGFLKSCFAYR